jgi:hypothetical protein
MMSSLRFPDPQLVSREPPRGRGEESEEGKGRGGEGRGREERRGEEDSLLAVH